MAAILWAESGTGVKWAAVRLGNELTERGLWAILTGHAAAGENRWRYSWAEAKKSSGGYGGWERIGGGLTGSQNAYNCFEDINDGWGIEGNGVNVNHLEGDEHMRPCPDGTPVRLREVVTADGDIEYWFAWTNGIAKEGSSSSSSGSSSSW